jgi:alpha-beta hydrolase superfamily lysophospholipase
LLPWLTEILLLAPWPPVAPLLGSPSPVWSSPGPVLAVTAGPKASAAAFVNGRTPLTGGAIRYTQAGSGPAVLLIHGLGGTRRTWEHLIPGLARTLTVIAPDLPGHGLSAPPAGGYSLGAYAYAMRDLLLALRHPRASVVGHGLGAGSRCRAPINSPNAPSVSC